MNFHSTTASRIRETDSTCTVEHRIIVHYSDTNRAVKDTTAVVVVKSFEEVKACPTST